MDLKPLFDSFYDKLVLRDLFGKVVPGVGFMFSAVAGLEGIPTADRVFSKLEVFPWLVVLGAAWLAGFALQYLGELLRLLRTHPRGVDGTGTRVSFFAEWMSFHNQATLHEKVHAERLNVIKEACGNAAVSILCAVVFLAVGMSQRGQALHSGVAVFALGFGVAVCLWRMHVIHIERYGEFVRNTNAHYREHPPTIPGATTTPQS